MQKQILKKKNHFFVIFCLLTKEIYKFLLCNDVAVERNTGKIIRKNLKRFKYLKKKSFDISSTFSFVIYKNIFFYTRIKNKNEFLHLDTLCKLLKYY